MTGIWGRSMIWRKRERLTTSPATAAGKRIYAVGDIHGRLDLLDRVLDAVDDDLRVNGHAQAQLVFLGDYVDRGPHSAGVIHRLVEVMETYNAVCLSGNHELMFSAFLDKPQTLKQWRMMGALATLASYGITGPPHPSAREVEVMAAQLSSCMPLSHHVFLNNRPLTSTCGDYLFVHAGVHPRRALARQGEADLLWIRDDFLNAAGAFEKFIVHGHTPVPAPDIRPNRINIDTGACATGRLSCLVLEGEARRFLSP